MRNFDDGIQMYELEFAVLIVAGTNHTAISLYEIYKHVKLKSARHAHDKIYSNYKISWQSSYIVPRISIQNGS